MKISRCQPLGDRVVVKREEPPKQSEGGILLPETSSERQQHMSKRGTVLAVGPGKLLDDGKRLPMNVAIGNKVLFSNYCGQEFELNGEKVLLLSESEILAVEE